ncbi:N-acetyl-L,L-diaminopimelate aminotransferase [Geomicrobium sp. JCM 19037]|uniref:aminotransferase A n=1 Tax=Geomicrobium sp. JCM 19037 TaxID=1460634 RepID=UPI00045F3874|nr:aminotransferase A [Geomicrobium sp. JCM 19037]GAK01936.1 N-acetyl-L,L-diaminopimelate aminotransferase [Geomicrobium sp. JCM 19037]
MSEWEKLVNDNVQSIEVSGIRQFFNRVSEVPNAVQLTLGQPDFPTPDHVKEAAIQAINEGNTTYTPNAGILPLRKAASRFLNSNYNLDYDPQTEVITTVGASEALDLVMRTLINEGDEVIVPAPAYPAYESLIRMRGAEPVWVDTRETQFKLTAEALQEKITSKTKAVILSYPSNPTGVTLNEQELQAIADVLVNQQIFIISDEIYSELVYEGTHVSIASLPKMKERTFVVNGVSKSHSMTGWRIGFLFGPASLMKQMLKVHQYNVSCASSVSQYAALQALEHGQDDPQVMREAYQKRRDYIMERLDAMNLPFASPSGAFYLFVSIEKTGLSSFEFADRLLNEAQLAAVPGTAFSTYGEGFIRISYAYSMDNLKEAADRLETFVKRFNV